MQINDLFIIEKIQQCRKCPALTASHIFMRAVTTVNRSLITANVSLLIFLKIESDMQKLFVYRFEQPCPPLPQGPGARRQVKVKRC